MFSVVHAPLLWGLALLGVPILIHLINRLRHRRIGWAAMEFLLASQKRSRNWILLKQLLLLLLRIAAVAAIVLMLAQPHNQWAALIGRAKTHHIVLVDDSYSMSDRCQRFQRAGARPNSSSLRLAEQAGRADNPQVFTLLRFSQAGAGPAAPSPTCSNSRSPADCASGWPASWAAGPARNWPLDRPKHWKPSSDCPTRTVPRSGWSI